MRKEMRATAKFPMRIASILSCATFMYSATAKFPSLLISLPSLVEKRKRERSIFEYCISVIIQYVIRLSHMYLLDHTLLLPLFSTIALPRKLTGRNGLFISFSDLLYTHFVA